MEKNEVIRYRGYLLTIASGLEIARRGVLAIISDLEKEYHIEPVKGNGHVKTVVTSSIEDTGGANFEDSSKSSL